MIDLEKHRAFHTDNATAAANVLEATDLGVDAIPEPFRRIARKFLAGAYVAAATSTEGLRRLRMHLAWELDLDRPEALAACLGKLEKDELETALSLLRQLKPHMDDCQELEAFRGRVVNALHLEITRRASVAELEINELTRLYGADFDGCAAS